MGEIATAFESLVKSFGWPGAMLVIGLGIVIVSGRKFMVWAEPRFSSLLDAQIGLINALREQLGKQTERLEHHSDLLEDVGSKVTNIDGRVEEIHQYTVGKVHDRRKNRVENPHAQEFGPA